MEYPAVLSSFMETDLSTVDTETQTGYLLDVSRRNPLVQ
jgi:hypothetical protein